jgi:hypothetical protein
MKPPDCTSTMHVQCFLLLGTAHVLHHAVSVALFIGASDFLAPLTPLFNLYHCACAVH